MMRSLRKLPARLATTLALVIAATSAWSADLRTILDNTAVVPPAQVGFREERNNPILKEPMILTGHLEYISAGILRKVVDEPFEEDILIEADHIVVTRDGKTRKLALKRIRSLQTILGAIEAILSGDIETLDESFSHELSGSNEAWTLRMTPESRAVARRITALTVTGNESSVATIRIDLPEDEWHLMSILPDSPTR